MQTFLPYPLFNKSASVLDDARLRKQQVEAEQILKVLSTPTAKGWANHPAVLQWRGYELALQCYIHAISRECTRRGFRGRHDDGPTEIFFHNSFPWWMADEQIANKIYDSHKSRLLFKGRVDSACVALKQLSIKKINEWLVSNGYPVKNQFKITDITKLELFLSDKNINPVKNHYRQFWPELDDTIPYFWPVTKNTSKNE